MDILKDRPFGLRLYSEVLEEGLQYIDDRRHGRIKSFKTPWVGLNRAGVNGLEWGSLITIGARPGAGKTMIVSQILRESRINNPDQQFNILEFQFEMGAKQSASRAFAAETALDYDIVLSSSKQLDDFSFGLMKTHIQDCKALEKAGIYRTQINTPLTHKEIRDAIHRTYNALGGKPLIVTIDHSWLIKRTAEEKEKIATIYNTTETLMRVKNELPVIILMITQLNRGMDETSRKIPGTLGNYPTSSDIFGGDALMQGSDMVLGLSNPYKANIMPVYGQKGYKVLKDDLYVHLIKVRNGKDDNNVLFMKGNFDKQKMIEISEPLATNPSNQGYRPTYQQRTASAAQLTTASLDSNDNGDFET